jgi:hypothetical protein
MWKTFEQFCKDHEKTIEFFQTVATLLAVIVSLFIAWLARRASNTRLRARFQKAVSDCALLSQQIPDLRRHFDYKHGHIATTTPSLLFAVEGSTPTKQLDGDS